MTHDFFDDEWLERLERERKNMMRSARPCPRCRSTQVQATYYDDNFHDWKCRECLHKWTTPNLYKGK